MVKNYVLYIFILLMVTGGCQHTISLDTEDRERADKLIKNLSVMEQRFQSIDTRLREINTNAFHLRGELSGVREGTDKLQKQLEKLQKSFFGTR